MSKLSADKLYLPYEISALAEYASGDLSKEAYSEIVELASMLHNLDIANCSELEKLLGAVHYEKKRPFDPDLDLDGMSDEDYADLVYEGRKLCEAEPIKGQRDAGYCGSVPRHVHDTQILDPSTWAHAATPKWAERAMEELGRDVIRADLKKHKAPKKISDRRLAVDATRRKNRNVVTG